MADRRLKLQDLLEQMLGSRSVYYQPPASVKMVYPAIRYSRNDVYKGNADNMGYHRTNQYQLIVIAKTPDLHVIDELLALPMCSFDRSYITDNLHHTVLTLYY